MLKNFTPHRNASLLLLYVLGSLIFWLPVNGQAPSLNFLPVISTGLNTPVDIVNAGDGTNRLYIVSQKAATVRVYEKDYTYVGTLVTVSGVRTIGDEEGLLSIVFHPDYENNRFFYVYYTNTNGDLELARYQTQVSNPVADPATKTIIITIPHPTNENHNGGKLHFGSDGYLYFATGDGGGGGDVPNNAQSGNTLLGKMLRININTGSATPYTIPPGNPYSPSNDNIRDEIWALGLRNPFRWSFDRSNGDMWIGDVGQGAWEEISYKAGPSTSTGGVNYGWRCFEGNHSYNGCTVLSGPGTYVPPVFEYPNASGPAAVTGGIVYRGTVFPSLVGYYVASDFYSGIKYLIKSNGSGGWTTATQGGSPDWIAAFGETENGDTLYALSLRGTLYKITASAQAPTPVSLVSFTGNQKNGAIDLTWQTQNEVNVKHYEIESSSNGIDFQLVGIITAKNSQSYRFSHTANGNNKIYYRLRILDIDGKSEYSKIIQIQPSISNEANFARPSVITNNVLNLVIQESFSQVQLMSMEGKQVWLKNINGRTGNQSYPLPALLPGSYVIRLVSNERILTQKIVIR